MLGANQRRRRRIAARGVNTKGWGVVRFKLILAGALIAGCWCAQASTAAPMYHLTDLGTLGGNASYATVVNNRGDVVGYSETGGTNPSHAFLYSSGALNDLGSAFGGSTFPASINDDGVIVGVGLTATHDEHGFMYANGTYTDLRPFGIFSAGGINAAGQVAAATLNRAVIYSNGTVTDLGTLGGNTSSGGAINDNGQVVGGSRTGKTDPFGTPVMHAFLYQNGSMQDLGSLGGTFCGANAINSTGNVIVGTGYTVYYTPGGPNTEHAFRYSGGTMNDLGTLGGASSAAYGINSLDQIVGYAQVPGGPQHAFLYTTSMLDLNEYLDSSGLGWTLSVASDINDSSWITGWGITPGGRTHAFLLTPIPEPSSLGILIVIALIVDRRFCRQCRKQESHGGSAARYRLANGRDRGR